METQSREQPRYIIQSAATTLEVLLAFGRAPGQFTPSELASFLGLDRNQVFRCLRTLQHVGFVRQDDDCFSLTPLVSQLNDVVAAPPSLHTAATPFLDELNTTTGETVNLFILNGDSMASIDHREGLRPVRLVTEPWQNAPLNAGACPKAALAFMKREDQERILAEFDQLPRLTPYTVQSREELHAELEVIRHRGYAISDLDVDEEARGVGAPIFDHHRQVIGAVSVGGPASRMTSARLHELGEKVIQTAQLISRQLGYLPS